jgi:hypothetical protein
MRKSLYDCRTQLIECYRNVRSVAGTGVERNAIGGTRMRLSQNSVGFVNLNRNLSRPMSQSLLLWAASNFSQVA